MREPAPSGTNPKWLAAERKSAWAGCWRFCRRWLSAGAWAGSKLSPAAAQLDPAVALAERYTRQQSHPTQYGLMTPEALSLQRAAGIRKPILTAAADLRHRLRSGLFAVWRLDWTGHWRQTGGVVGAFGPD
jgi:hypothetical protein